MTHPANQPDCADSVPFDQPLVELASAAQLMLDALMTDGAVRLTHLFLGKLSLLDGLGLSTAQLPEEASR